MWLRDHVASFSSSAQARALQAHCDGFATVQSSIKSLVGRICCQRGWEGRKTGRVRKEGEGKAREATPLSQEPGSFPVCPRARPEHTAQWPRHRCTSRCHPSCFCFSAGHCLGCRGVHADSSCLPRPGERTAAGAGPRLLLHTSPGPEAF